MTTLSAPQPQSRSRRFWRPVLLFIVIWLLSDLLVFGLLGNETLIRWGIYRPLQNLFAGTRFLLLLAGTLLIYPILYFRGATWPERVSGCFLLPLVYAITAMIRATSFFPLGHAIYYGFNPLMFGSTAIQIGLIGLMEIICRAIYRLRSGQSVRVVQWYLLASIIVGSAALYITLLWDGGVHWFYVYQQGFRLLFQ